MSVSARELRSSDTNPDRGSNPLGSLVTPFAGAIFATAEAYRQFRGVLPAAFRKRLTTSLFDEIRGAAGVHRHRASQAAATSAPNGNRPAGRQDVAGPAGVRPRRSGVRRRAFHANRPPRLRMHAPADSGDRCGRRGTILGTRLALATRARRTGQAGAPRQAPGRRASRGRGLSRATRCAVPLRRDRSFPTRRG